MTCRIAGRNDFFNIEKTFKSLVLCLMVWERVYPLHGVVYRVAAIADFVLYIGRLHVALSSQK